MDDVKRKAYEAVIAENGLSAGARLFVSAESGIAIARESGNEALAREIEPHIGQVVCIKGGKFVGVVQFDDEVEP